MRRQVRGVTGELWDVREMPHPQTVIGDIELDRQSNVGHCHTVLAKQLTYQ